MQEITINTFMEHIDESDFEFYASLSDEDKKKFSPYMALRWMSCVSDSVVVKYKANMFEQYIGKWKESGKKTANEIVDAFNNANNGGCIGVSKVGESKYDWNIVFSVDNKDIATNLVAFIDSMIGSCPGTISSTMPESDHAAHLLATNNIVNVDFFDTSTNHPELSYKLLCVASAFTGTKKTRSWFPMVKSTNDNQLLSFLKEYLRDPCMRQIEMRIVLKNMSKDAFINALESTDIVPKQDHKKYIELYEREISI